MAWQKVINSRRQVAKFVVTAISRRQGRSISWRQKTKRYNWRRLHARAQTHRAQTRRVKQGIQDVIVGQEETGENNSRNRLAVRTKAVYPKNRWSRDRRLGGKSWARPDWKGTVPRYYLESDHHRIFSRKSLTIAPIGWKESSSMLTVMWHRTWQSSSRGYVCNSRRRNSTRVIRSPYWRFWKKLGMHAIVSASTKMPLCG